MSIVVLQLPDVKRKTEIRPEKCPYCQGETFQRWGKVRKPVRDNRYRSVQVYRYRCCHCRRTFRHYPRGSGSSRSDPAAAQAGAGLWVLGMSLRGVATALGCLSACRSVTCRCGEICRNRADHLEKQRHWQGVRVLGLDGAYLLGWGQAKHPVLVAVDLGHGQPVAIGYLDESNPQAVRRFLEPLVQRLGVSVIVTDDLASFRTVAEKLGLEHQVCQFHVRRWVGRTLKELQATIPKNGCGCWMKSSSLLAELPPGRQPTPV